MRPDDFREKLIELIAESHGLPPDNDGPAGDAADSILEQVVEPAREAVMRLINEAEREESSGASTGAAMHALGIDPHEERWTCGMGDHVIPDCQHKADPVAEGKDAQLGVDLAADR